MLNPIGSIRPEQCAGVSAIASVDPVVQAMDQSINVVLRISNGESRNPDFAQIRPTIAIGVLDEEDVGR